MTLRHAVSSLIFRKLGKRGMELSMNTIVIAVAVLLVLVVVLIVFGGRMGLFTQGLDDCAGRGGCIMNADKSAVCVAAGGAPSMIKQGDENKVCCIGYSGELKDCT